MARAELVVNLYAGNPEPVDGDLCPACLLPALIAVPVHMMCGHGVTQVGTITACTTCAEVIR